MGKKLSIDQVAKDYNISRRSVRRYIAEGRLTAIRVGPHMIRLDAEQVARELGEPVTGGAT